MPQARFNSIYESKLGMVPSSSQLYRCPIPISCKLSDPLKVIPDGREEGGIQSPLSAPFTENTINRLSSPTIYLYERGNARVKKTLKPSGSIVFRYLNALCCETKW